MVTEFHKKGYFSKDIFSLEIMILFEDKETALGATVVVIEA